MTRPAAGPPGFVLAVFRELQARQLALGCDDLLALRQALGAGFGLASRDELVELCVTLWAKSPTEAAMVRMLFERRQLPDWAVLVGTAAAGPTGGPEAGAGLPVPGPAGSSPQPAGAVEAPLTVARTKVAGVPRLPARPTRQFVLAPQFPLSSRAVAQTFRRLRQPVREGPATELDVDATTERRARTGLASPPVLVPRRRNRARLILLVDRQGSMSPFHPYLDHLRDAIVEDSKLDTVYEGYFHDSPVDRADPRVLARLSGMFPTLDSVLASIRPSARGIVFGDPLLRKPVRLGRLLDDASDARGAVIVSDAGAARQSYDAERLVASVAFARELRRRNVALAWLNPVPREGWAGTTAAELARHVPMFALDGEGLHRAVDVLRGRPVALERPA